MASSDAHLITDIGFAAAKAGLDSIAVKVDVLPENLRLAATIVALNLVAAKAASVAAVVPGAAELAGAVVAGAKAQDERFLREQLQRHGFDFAVAPAAEGGR